MPPATDANRAKTQTKNASHDVCTTSFVVYLVIPSILVFPWTLLFPRPQSSGDCLAFSFLGLVDVDHAPFSRRRRRRGRRSELTSLRSDSCTGLGSDSGLGRRRAGPSASSGCAENSSALIARWSPFAAWYVGAWCGHTPPGRLEEAGRAASRRSRRLEWSTLFSLRFVCVCACEGFARLKLDYGEE